MSRERTEFYPGDRVVDRADGRAGSVKATDYGGVYVDMDATETLGRETRVCNAYTLDHEGER